MLKDIDDLLKPDSLRQPAVVFDRFEKATTWSQDSAEYEEAVRLM